MIILVVARDPHFKEPLRDQFSSRGGNLIQYRNPVKAMDNLEEIQPDLIIFNTQDFPRHWKPFVRFYRTLKNKDQGICVLFTGDLFTEDEAAKSQLLEVNGLVPYPQDEHFIRSSVEEILQRYALFSEERRFRRYTPKEYDEISFMFSHPDNYAIIAGTIIDISIHSVRFYPDAPDKTNDIPENSVISDCSLQIDDEILTFSSRLVRNNKILTLDMEMSENDRNKLSRYLAEAAERALSTHSS
ncbi:PilZ domain-containing protein [Marispirochaeta sp.]|uniref:PilZ domain-containing protein n=1 Tax=Marispirochaeta sp. TaxID=2038653 RepID=UPI0029C7E687|nr:PilZ domain-containing protein [Marispirochaeta sp.]